MSLTIETIFGRRSDLWPAPLWYSSDLRSVCVADSMEFLSSGRLGCADKTGNVFSVLGSSHE